MHGICKKCGRGEMLLSEPKNLMEYLAHVAFRRPFICSYCNARTLRFSLWYRHHKRAGHKKVQSSWADQCFSPTSTPPPDINEVRSKVREMEQKQDHTAHPQDPDS